MFEQATLAVAPHGPASAWAITQPPLLPIAPPPESWAYAFAHDPAALAESLAVTSQWWLQVVPALPSQPAAAWANPGAPAAEAIVLTWPLPRP
jgi:hypothetical protein